MAKAKETLIPRPVEPASSAPPSTAAASVVGLSKRFGKASVLENISFDVGEGEVLVLLGASGSGKTTILRIIAGLEMPYTGKVILHGKDVTELPARERGVGVIFQSYALFPKMTVEKNIGYGLRIRKRKRKEIKETVNELLSLVQLEEHRKKYPSQLSGGQQQRVALARALINHPRVLLLDEPLGALDLKLRKQMQVELKGIQREVGITFLYVTHDQEEALAMSDRIAVMDRGEVRQCGTPEEVYERPEGPFVAGFIGISNLLPATVENGGVKLPAGQRFPAPVPSDCSDGSDVYLSVRPEKIWLDEREDGMVSVDGTIVERVYVGTTTQVIVELSPGVRLVALEQNAARQRSDDRWEIGQRVTLGWHPEHALVLR